MAVIQFKRGDEYLMKISKLEAALKDVTGSEVRIQYRDGKGSLQIDFYSDAQLSRYAELLGQYDPETAGDGESGSTEHFD